MISKLVSVIITTKNSSEYLEALLKSIKSQTYKNIEIILVDNNSTDNTKEIAKKYTKLVFNKGPERSAQRNFGAAKAKGNFLLFLDSDMVLSKNVISECVEAIRSNGGVIIPEYSFGEGFWAQCKALERSFYIGNENIEAARFYSDNAFKEAKGFDEDLTGPEDWNLSRKIKIQSGLGRINSMIGHNEGHLSLVYLLGKKFYYGKTFGNYTKASKRGMSSEELSPLKRFKIFFSAPRKLLKNPIVGGGMIFMKTLEYAAGGIGYLFRG